MGAAHPSAAGGGGPAGRPPAVGPKQRFVTTPHEILSKPWMLTEKELEVIFFVFVYVSNKEMMTVLIDKNICNGQWKRLFSNNLIHFNREGISHRLGICHECIHISLISEYNETRQHLIEISMFFFWWTQPADGISKPQIYRNSCMYTCKWGFQLKIQWKRAGTWNWITFLCTCTLNLMKCRILRAKSLNPLKQYHLLFEIKRTF